MMTKANQIREKESKVAEFKYKKSDSRRTRQVRRSDIRRLLAHLDANKDVQNIDLMILAGFCRNCFSKWYKAEAENLGLDLDIDDARERLRHDL